MPVQEVATTPGKGRRVGSSKTEAVKQAKMSYEKRVTFQAKQELAGLKQSDPPVSCAFLSSEKPNVTLCMMARQYVAAS
jgi:hypothetical protein